uniref:Serine/threonine-protein phosphatase n=1 Tax=Guillardia theta (strain CCMP2712) TaxID=905079 RepID=A0A0C3TYQ3_GUITC
MLLKEEEVADVCLQLKEILLNEPNVCSIRAPVTVVGDIHGQFHDLLDLFRVGGFCPSTNYLFLGDFVDRGRNVGRGRAGVGLRQQRSHSVETISLLACLSVRYPRRIKLIRGNHESRQITQVYGFYSECVRKYGDAAVWKHFTDLFDFLPLAAVIDESIFCVHGGLSPSVWTIEQISLIDRFQEIPSDGAAADLLWSDPDPNREGFNPSTRGAGYTFGADVVQQFLQENGLIHVLRAHQLCMEGYQVMFDNLLSTVWSAPNYCYRCGNLASILEVDEALDFHFNVFSSAPTRRSDSKNKLRQDFFL